MDPNENNVVLDREKSEPYIIDFGGSLFRENIKFHNDLTWETCCQLEEKQVRFLCGIDIKYPPMLRPVQYKVDYDSKEPIEIEACND